MARITYLGPEGTFTEAALLQMTAADLVPDIPDHGSADLRRLPMESTVAALDAVRGGLADYACVPIENSIDGSVMPTLDSLAIGSALQVFAETTLDVAFSIVVKPGRTADGVAYVGGLPGRGRTGAAMAGRQSARRRTTAGLFKCRRGPAGGRRPGRCRGDLTAGGFPLGIGGPGRRHRRRAQRPYPLRPGGSPGPPPVRTGTDRTSVVLRIDNAPGALLAALAEFGIRGIDLTQDRIQADPHRTRHLPVLRGLPRPYRRRPGGRGAQGSAPSLRGRALPGFLADQAGRLRGAGPGG